MLINEDKIKLIFHGFPGPWSFLRGKYEIPLLDTLAYPTQHTTTNIVNLLYADEAACPTLCFIREHVHPSDVPAVAASWVGWGSN